MEVLSNDKDKEKKDKKTEKGKTEKEISDQISEDLKSTIGTWVSLYFLILLTDIFYNFMTFGIPYIGVRSLQIELISVIIVSMIFLILYAITGKSQISFIIVSILMTLLLCVNQIKIAYTDEPVEISDILFLSNASYLADIIEVSFISVVKQYISKILIYIAFVVIINIYPFIHRKSIKENKKFRVIIAVVPILVLFVMFVPSETITNFMLNVVYESDEKVDYDREVTNKKELALYGVISGIYEHLLESRFFEPDGYDEETVNEEMENIEDYSDDNSLGQSNVIVLFAESFWDIDLLEDVEFDQKITENFQNLKEDGIFFDMISPSYGGVSSNVEFEFLTGASLSYFPQGYIPTMRLYNNDSYYDNPSIIEEFNNNGYRTKIVNYTESDSFEISDFYEYLCVDEIEFNTDVDEEYYKGYYVSDEYVIDQIIKEFDNKEDGEKLFYMTLSMQSHMEYQIEKYDSYDISIENSPYSDEMNETLLSYAQGIYDMDKQLRKII